MSKRDKYASSYTPVNQRRRQESSIKRTRWHNGTFYERTTGDVYEAWVIFDDLQESSVLVGAAHQRAQPGVPGLVKQLRERLHRVQEAEKMDQRYGGAW
jgi:hypothetical protein